MRKLPMMTTIQQHVLQQQEDLFPEARGIFSSLISGMALATKAIQAQVRRAGLSDHLGAAGATNSHGEEQQKLDVYANQMLLHCLGRRDAVAMLVSEENEEPVTFDRARDTGRYIVVFDPLDGSSNIDVNVPVGTIFSIFRRPAGEPDPTRAVMQPGSRQVAAGYVVYGSSTVFVYTAGRGVFGFTLDPSVGAYVLSFENMKMPRQGMYYSVNEANADAFPPAYREYLARLRKGSLGHAYSSRYVGSLVADFHRTLLKGGVFLYPPTRSHARGKLRLMYEANPLAFIAEQAGGMATDGARRIADIQPEAIHQRTPLVIGSQVEMEAFDQCRKDVEAPVAAGG
ncbi:MAG TPA: class 1 fructose-bisphosphatase [Bryobacteraceae bacterium]|nr:class 1 fructose-bisphosphatase [Bryobacteraceae bacterium]